MTARDDIDLDIQRARIGKRDEILVNPHPVKERKPEKPYSLPPMNVRDRGYRHDETSDPYRAPAENPYDDNETPGWLMAAVLVLGIIGAAKLIGVW